MNLNHPAPWVALPADGADLVDGVGMWFFNDANGEEVFYGHAMSIEARNLVLAAVNGVPDPADVQAVQDAARYRWARANWGRIVDTYEGDTGHVLSVDVSDGHTEGWHTEPVSLDTAIDAAMQSNQGGR